MRSSASRQNSADQARRGSKQEECSEHEENVLEYIENLNRKHRELQGYLEVIEDRKQSVAKNLELIKGKINQAAEEVMKAVDREREKLIQEADLFGASTHQELSRTEKEILVNIRTREEFLHLVNGLRSCTPEEQAIQLLDLRNQQKQLDAVRLDLTTGSLKFNRKEALKGSLIGHVSIGDIDASDPYSEQPVEVGLIDGEQTVAGVAVLRKKIYIIRDFMANVEVYNERDLSRHKIMKLEGLRKPSDITPDITSGFLYISDAAGCVYKLEPENAVLTKFLTDVGGEPQGLYVVPSKANTAGNLLVTCYDTRQLREFTSEGNLVRSVRFQQDVVSPWHVVPLLSSWWTGGDDSDEVVKKYALCHGWDSSKLHRICWVDGSGKILKAFGTSNGSGAGKVDVPTRMAVDNFGYLLVADRNNNRILLLSPNLIYVRDLINKTSGIKQPRRICLDTSTSYLYVGLIDGSVHIFRLLDKTDQLETP